MPRKEKGEIAKDFSNKQAHKWSAETQSVAQTNGESRQSRRTNKPNCFSKWKPEKYEFEEKHASKLYLNVKSAKK